MSESGKGKVCLSRVLDVFLPRKCHEGYKQPRLFALLELNLRGPQVVPCSGVSSDSDLTQLSSEDLTCNSRKDSGLQLVHHLPSMGLFFKQTPSTAIFHPKDGYYNFKMDLFAAGCCLLSAVKV